MAWSRKTFWFKLNFPLPKNESVLNILVYLLEQFQRFSWDLIFRQQENLVDNHKCQARFWPLCNKILLQHHFCLFYWSKLNATQTSWARNCPIGPISPNLSFCFIEKIPPQDFYKRTLASVVRRLLSLRRVVAAKII